MKIASSHIGLTGQSHSERLVTQKETLRMWVGDTRPNFEGTPTQAAPRTDTVALSDAARQRPKATAKPFDCDQAIKDACCGQTKETAGCGSAGETSTTGTNTMMSLLAMIVERMTGEKIQIFDPNALQQACDEVAADGQALQDQQQAAQAAANEAQGQPQQAGWGIEYDRQETVHERESAAFCAQGTVKTADGQCVAFDISLQMNRERISVENFSFRAGDAKLKDPLVINFGGTAAELLDETFAFDLDVDGKTDQVSFLRPSSAYLTLDRNADGKINNGTELFGPQSGDGFADLAALDDDGNQWIDENDAAFSQLRLWQGGTSMLTALKDGNVGAIYLGHVSTQYALRDAQFAQQGQIRDSGVYLREDGTAGTIQQIDLKI